MTHKLKNQTSFNSNILYFNLRLDNSCRVKQNYTTIAIRQQD